MSLSNQVKESVTQAAGNLREALAFAARTEHPVVISSLTDVLMRLESLEHVDEIMEKFGNPRELPTNLGH
jgi:DNA repair photolyase